MASFKTEYDALCEIHNNIMKLDKTAKTKSNHIIEWLKTDIVNAMLVSKFHTRKITLRFE